MCFGTVFYPPIIGIEESILFEGKRGNMLSLKSKSVCLDIYLSFKLRAGSFSFLRLLFFMFQINLFAFQLKAGNFVLRSIFSNFGKIFFKNTYFRGKISSTIFLIIKFALNFFKLQQLPLSYPSPLRLCHSHIYMYIDYFTKKGKWELPSEKFIKIFVFC